MLETKTEFHWIHAHSDETPLQASAYVRRLDLASFISNCSSCCLQSPWIVPKLLYGMYGEIACTLCDELSVRSVISMNHSGSVGATTGDPFWANV